MSKWKPRRRNLSVDRSTTAVKLFAAQLCKCDAISLAFSFTGYMFSAGEPLALLGKCKAEPLLIMPVVKELGV